MTAFRTLLALSAVFGFAAHASADVVQRYAVVVGANDGGSSRPLLRYAITDAERFGRVLGELGGVSPANAVVLRDPTSQGLHDALSEVAGRIELDRKRGSGRTEILFYYSGHADEQGLLLGGDRVSYVALRRRLDTVPADVRIAVLDACASGAFTRLKGGKARPPFRVDPSTTTRGHAFLASSAANESAQESDRIRASYFTHYLVSALRGAGDASGDGRVTLNEAYQFAFAETVGRTVGTTGGAQHPSYDISLSGAGDVVMTDVASTTAALELAEDLEGRVYVMGGSQSLVAELAKARGRRVAIGLDPGTYDLRLESEAGSQRARVAVADGQHARVGPALFASVAKERTRLRGDAGPGWFPVDGATRVSMMVGGWGSHGRVLNRLTSTSLDIAGAVQASHHLSDRLAFSVGLHAFGAENVSAFLGGYALPIGLRWNPRMGDPSTHRLKPYLGTDLIGVIRTSESSDRVFQRSDGVGYGLGTRLLVGADVHLTPRWAVGASVGYHAFPFTSQSASRDDYRGRQIAFDVSWLALKGR